MFGWELWGDLECVCDVVWLQCCNSWHFTPFPLTCNYQATARYGNTMGILGVSSGLVATLTTQDFSSGCLEYAHLKTYNCWIFQLFLNKPRSSWEQELQLVESILLFPSSQSSAGASIASKVGVTELPQVRIVSSSSMPQAPFLVLDPGSLVVFPTVSDLPVCDSLLPSACCCISFSCRSGSGRYRHRLHASRPCSHCRSRVYWCPDPQGILLRRRCHRSHHSDWKVLVPLS